MDLDSLCTSVCEKAHKSWTFWAPMCICWWNYCRQHFKLTKSEWWKLQITQPTKKWSNVAFGAIFVFLRCKNPYKKQDEIQKLFLKDLVLLMAKGFFPLSRCENVWMRRLVLRLEPKVVNFFLKRCWLKNLSSNGYLLSRVACSTFA
jgi:hypothetical protein